MNHTATTRHAPNFMTTQRALEGDELFEGQIVGPYRIIEEVGSGGFARVYKAEHIRLGSFVALKVLHKFLALSPRMLARFEQEAVVTNRIAHPAVVHVYDISELSDGRPYIALDWLEGTSLSTLLSRTGRFTCEEACSVIRQLGGALACAHHVGVIHRDIKPSNVFAVPNGDWYDFKLLDFGIAKVLERSDGTVTTTGTRIGSPHYMTPEQILGKTVDARTDIYALGVLAYQLLSGRLPFDGVSDLEVEILQVRSTPQALNRFCAVSPTMEAWVSRCMAKRPEDRFEDIGAALRALDNPRQAAERQVIALQVEVSSTNDAARDVLIDVARRAADELGLELGLELADRLTAFRAIPPDEDGARRTRATCTAGALALRRRLEAFARSRNDCNWQLRLCRCPPSVLASETASTSGETIYAVSSRRGRSQGCETARAWKHA